MCQIFCEDQKPRFLLRIEKYFPKNKKGMCEQEGFLDEQAEKDLGNKITGAAVKRTSRRFPQESA